MAGDRYGGFPGHEERADDGTRTHDLLHGKGAQNPIGRGRT